MVQISLNGETRATAAPDVASLVDELKLAAQTLLIEYNGAALHRSEWSTTPLRNQDRLEMLRVAAGG